MPNWVIFAGPFAMSKASPKRMDYLAECSSCLKRRVIRVTWPKDLTIEQMFTRSFKFAQYLEHQDCLGTQQETEAAD